MQLRALIEPIETLKVDGSLSVEVTGLAYEARRVSAGDIYFALQRGNSDGHSEIELAVQRGAVAVICRRNGAMRQRVTTIEVADTRGALADVSARFYGGTSDELRVIGVSGSGGAWKTAFLLTSILRASGVNAGLISELRHEFGERRLPAGSALESCDVHRFFAEMVRAGCGTCVLQLPEVTLTSTRGMPLDVLVLTDDEQNLWRLSEFMNQSTARRPSCGILNVEKQDGREAACAVLFDAHVTFGFSSAAQVSAQDVQFSTATTEGTLYIGNENVRFELPLVGRENLTHLLAASAAAFASDLTAEQIGRALQELQTPPGSLERVPTDQPFAVFVDEARDERSLEIALRSLREITTGRILLAFGAGEKTAGKERFGMGRVAAKYAQYMILTGDNPGREPVEQICGVIAQGIESVGTVEYHFQPNRAEAIAELIGMARPGDVLLIGGKGDRVYQEFANTIVPFDDKAIALERLAPLPAPRARSLRRELVPA
jgi:UDP-N-acetylmuramoyl-L-alanyl-D-glutamate--2,6-diaminopimelate ligase